MMARTSSLEEGVGRDAGADLVAAANDAAPVGQDKRLGDLRKWMLRLTRIIDP